MFVGSIGSGPTSGTVTVADTIPTGLIMQSLSGQGWGCSFPAKTCNRSDALSAGSASPDIVVRVLVMPTAPPTVTNTVTVSGGGDTTPSNHTYSNPTTILERQSERPDCRPLVSALTSGRCFPYLTSTVNGGVPQRFRAKIAFRHIFMVRAFGLFGLATGFISISPGFREGLLGLFSTGV